MTGVKQCIKHERPKQGLLYIVILPLDVFIKYENKLS